MAHHILIVDDDPYVLGALKALLKTQGYKVDAAGSGEEALQMLESMSPNLIMVDYMMPDMDGIELCQKTFARCPYAIRILITGCYDFQVAQEAINEANVYKYITKPWQSDNLLLTVRRALEHHDLIWQMMQTEKMISLGKMAASVAHEINNPAGFVASNLVTLTEYMDAIKRILAEYGTLAEAVHQKEDVSDILAHIDALRNEDDLPFILQDVGSLVDESKEGVDRIRKTVQGLRKFVRVDREIVDADVNDGLRQGLKLVWNQLKYKCKVELDLEDLPPVRCCFEQLQQVFMNLIINAVQAIPSAGGTIRIQTKTEGVWVVVRISDTGKGIAEKHLPKIFDPFFTTKTSGEGTGLGLSIASEIVRRHRGKIEVVSSEGGGTTFEVYLPFATDLLANNSFHESETDLIASLPARK